MQTSHLSFKKSIWGSLSLLLALVSLLSISSCNGGKEKEEDFGPSCVTMQKSKIQNVWVEQNFTQPGGADLIVWLKFGTSYGGAGTNFMVNVQGLRADYSEIAGSTFNLSTGATCLATLPPNIAIGSNSILLSDLDILESNGTLKSDFNYVKLTPQAYPRDTDFMNFTVDVIAGGITLERPETRPCPPCQYCKPPDCPEIVPVDSTKSTKSMPADSTK